MRVFIAIGMFLIVSMAYAGEPDRAVLVQIDEKLDQQQLDESTLDGLASQLEGLTSNHSDSPAVWLRLGLVQARMGKLDLALPAVLDLKPQFQK